MLREKLEAEFKASYKNLRKRASQVKWDTLCPELELREKVKDRKLNIIEDLWEADMGKALRWTFSDDTDGSKYGNLRLMSTHSKASIGSLLSSGFDERCHWAGNFIMHKDNVCLGPAKLEKLVILRMVREWLVHMRKHHGHVLRQRFGMTLIPATKNKAPEYCVLWLTCNNSEGAQVACCTRHMSSLNMCVCAQYVRARARAHRYARAH